MAHILGGNVAPCENKEYGRTEVEVDPQSQLFRNFKPVQTTLMSHTDHIFGLPDGFVSTANTPSCPNAAIENRERRLYGVQFHPEVKITENGIEMIRRFCLRNMRSKRRFYNGRF